MRQATVMSENIKVEKVSGFLPALPPFDFGHSLRFLEGFTPTKGQQNLVGEKLTKAISLKGQPVVFTIEASQEQERPGLNYILFGLKLDAEIIKMAEQAISDYLSLQDDLTELYRVGENDPAFAPVLKALYGYHQVRFLTPFENAVWSIISQRTPMAVAAKLKAQIAERYGPKLEMPDEEGHIIQFTAFPEPEVFAAINEDELRELFGNSRKPEYLINVAQAFSASLLPEATKGLSREALKERLLAVKGIGPWSAEFVLIRGFGRMGGLPKDEKRLEEVVSQIYNGGKAVSEADMQRFAQPYGQSQGYWAHYLRVAG